MIQGVGIGLGGIGSEREYVARGRIVAIIVGSEVYGPLPDLVLRVIVPMSNLPLAPSLPRPLIQDMGAY